jgi:hypothetical protein
MRLKTNIEQLRSDYSRLKSKVSRKNSHVVKSLEGNLQSLKKCKGDLAQVKKEFQTRTEDISLWMKGELEKMVRSGILIDTTEVKLKSYTDLVSWGESRLYQASLKHDLESIKEK